MSLQLINRQLVNKSLLFNSSRTKPVTRVLKFNLSTLNNNSVTLKNSQILSRNQNLLKLNPLNSLNSQLTKNFATTTILKNQTTNTTTPTQPKEDPKTENNDKQEPRKKQTLQDLIKKYGLSAFIVWMVVAGADIVFCFIVLYLAGEDQVRYFENLGKDLWEYFGFKIDSSKSSILSGDGGKGEKPTLLSTFIVAYSLHHLTVPYRLPIAIALTPMVARRLAKISWLAKYITPKK